MSELSDMVEQKRKYGLCLEKIQRLEAEVKREREFVEISKQHYQKIIIDFELLTKQDIKDLLIGMDGQIKRARETKAKR